MLALLTGKNMRTNALLALALVIAVPSFAEEKDYERAEGKADCKAFVYTERAVTSMHWTGACKEGYADGTGVMEWKYEGEKAVSRYEGDMRKGRRHGAGYLKLSSGSQYEGGFSDGKFHGTGTLLTYASRYDGEWVAGKQHGLGKTVYAVGGSYEGQWQQGKFHGKGTVTYTGGRTMTAEFVEGRRVDQAPAAPTSDKEYRINPANSYYLLTPMASSNGIPFSRSYDAMSAAEKQGVRDIYILDDDDEPPYPANGTQRLYERIVAAQQERQAQGSLYMHVHIDSSGSPTSVTTYASPDTTMTKWVSSLLVKEKYKPGVCQGKPCAMRFPISVSFTSEGN